MMATVSLMREAGSPDHQSPHAAYRPASSLQGREKHLLSKLLVITLSRLHPVWARDLIHFLGRLLEDNEERHDDVDVGECWNGGIADIYL